VFALDQKEFDQWANDFKALKNEPTTDSAKKGQAIFKSKCLACHAVGPAAPNGFPNLSTIGDRAETANILDNNENEVGGPVDPELFKKNMDNWLTNTPTVKPGNEMPLVPLTQPEKDALIEYLSGLKLNK
jgi:cytochrome c oxidase subunit 2